MQRILLIFLTISSIYSNKFAGFVSIAIVDSMTGKNDKILLEVNKTVHDEKKYFAITTLAITPDPQNPAIGWIDLEISYQPSSFYKPITKSLTVCTNQVYQFLDRRYMIGFDVSVYVNEELPLESTQQHAL